MEITINGLVSETYDNNIEFAKGEGKEDFITSLVLGLGVNYEGRKRVLEFKGQINRSFHATFTDIKSSSENLTMNFKNEFSKYDRIRLSDTFTHSHVPVTFEEEFGRIKGRRERYRNRFNFGYIRDISEHFKVISKYTNLLNNISEEGSSSSLHRAGLIIDYMQSVATTYFLSYSYQVINYEDAGNTSSHSIATGMRHYLTRRLLFDGRIGADFLTSFGFTRNFIKASLTNEIDENTATSLSFIRRDQSVSDREDVFSNWQIQGLLKRRLLKRLNGSFSGFYGQGKFVTSGIKDTFLGARGTISYEFTEHLAGNFSYLYSILDSSDETRGYKRNTASIGLTTVF